MEREIFLEEEGKESLEHLRQENFEIVSEVDIDVEKVDHTATVSIKRWDGSTKSVDIYDGERGPEGPVGPAGRDGVDGKDAKINGVNTLSIEAGDNITIDQEGSTLTISAEEGTIDYSDLENKPKINNVELSGNKTSSDLGLQPAGQYLTEETDPVFSASASSGITSEDITSWNNKSDFSGNYNDLTDKPTIPVVPTNVSAFTNDAGYTTNIGTITSVKMNGSTISSSGEADLGTVITDISGKQDTIDSSHKLSADLVDDTTTTNKFVTASDKTTWSGKQDALVSGTNIKTINNESLLGSGNITIQGGGTTYEINVTSQLKSSSNLTGLDTEANRTVYATIFANFDTIDVKSISIKAFHPTFSDYDYKYNVTQISKGYSDYSGGDMLYIYTDWFNVGYHAGYGVKYESFVRHCISVCFKNNVFYSVSDSPTTRYMFNEDDAVLGLTNTTSFTPSADYHPATKKYVDDNIPQKSSMPTANSSNSGKIIQYKGTTTSSYTNGYFYKCVYNGGTYSWTNINVQDGGSGGSTDVQINGTSIVSSDVANIITEGTYNSSTNKIATMSDVNALITYSTTDISEGDPLDSGTLYIVYE